MPSGGLRQDVEQNRNILVGEDRSIAWNVLDADDVAQAMTGWTLVFEVLDKRAGAILFTAASVTIQNGTATDDQALVTLADDDTETLGAGKFYYQLRREDAGQKGNIAFGDLIILPQTLP